MKRFSINTSALSLLALALFIGTAGCIAGAAQDDDETSTSEVVSVVSGNEPGEPSSTGSAGGGNINHLLGEKGAHAFAPTAPAEGESEGPHPDPWQPAAGPHPDPWSSSGNAGGESSSSSSGSSGKR